MILATNKSESVLEFAKVNHTTTADSDDVLINSNLIPGIYIYETSQNFDSYLKELGVNYILRQFAGWVTPIVNISTTCPHGDLTNIECEWTIDTKTVVKEHSVSFKLNEMKNDVTMDGRNVEFMLAQTRSNQWVEVQTDGYGSKKTKITRDFFVDRMQVTLEINTITAKSIFLRQNSTV